jgi:hypothetical protein
MKKLLFLILVYSISFLHLNAQENKIIGVLSAAVGKVSNQNGDELNTGDKIYFGDTIKVDEKSNSQILLLDQTVLNIGAKSEVTIDEFIFDPSNNDGKIFSLIKQGSMKVITGLISEKNPDNLVVKVPAGSIGTRGTEFQAIVNNNNQESKILLIGPGPANTLGLRPGVIEVANDLGSVVLDQPYTFTKMAPDTPPDPPITIPDIELNEFKESLEAKNTETIQEPEQIAQDNEITKETLYIDKSKDEVLGEILKDDEVILALANDPQEESNITNDEISTTSNEENLQETIIENSQTNTEDVEVVTDQTTINQLSNLVSNNELDIKEFFSLVGKDDEGNEIRALVKADTSTLISPSIVIRSEQGGASTNSLTTTTEEPASLSNETTIVETSTRTTEINIVESTSVSTATTSGVYKYDSGAIEMTSSGRGVFDGGSYRSISTVDFDNKTISTNYTGTLEVGYLAADLEFDVSTGDTSYTSDISQAFNFTLDSDGYHDRDNVLKSNITSLKAGGGLENGVNDFEVAGESTPQEMYNALDNGKFAGFGEFSTPSVGGVGSSSLKIEQANSGKGENFKSFQDSVEILSGSNSSITPIKQ